jgi:protein SCO1/2
MVRRSGFRHAMKAAATMLLAVAACSKPGGWAHADLGGAIITPSIPKPDFTLTDTRGEPFDFRRGTAGKVALLYFGYTHCPDVCPLQMSHLSLALHRLDSAVAARIAVVFVTTDSARDSLPRLRSWLDQFDSSFVGLTGGLERVNAIQTGTGILPASERQSDSAIGYRMGHSGLVLAFTPDDTAHLAFPPSTTEEGWVSDLRRLVEAGPPPARMTPGPLPAHPAAN